MAEMARAVEDVLEEIGAGATQRLLVLNKADLLEPDERLAMPFRHPDGMLVSATTGEGLEALRDRIEEEFLLRLTSVELLLPYGEGGRLAELHELAGELVREDTADGVLVSARLPPTVAARFERFAVNGRT